MNYNILLVIVFKCNTMQFFVQHTAYKTSSRRVSKIIIKNSYWLLFWGWTAHRHCCCSVDKSWPTLCHAWNAACQPPLRFTVFQSLLRFMSIESVMLVTHLILCRPLLLCLQSFPASGSFPVSWLFASGDCMRLPQSTWHYFIPWNSSSKYQSIDSPIPMALPVKGVLCKCTSRFNRSGMGSETLHL